ncbi:hypothetical protein NQ315_012947, partial [Exocentrus adspersus]
MHLDAYKMCTKFHKDIHNSFAAKKLLNKANPNQKDKLIFFKDCQNFLIATVSKILQRSCLQYNVVKGLSYFDPNLIGSSPSVAEKRFSTVLQEFYDKHLITSETAEKTKNQVKLFVRTQQEIFKNYGDEQLDVFFSKLLKNKPEMADLA